MSSPILSDPEAKRLAEDAERTKNWKRWGPYLSERQWGTVREDYSADGSCWSYFPHDHARSRAYRWGEDGLLGITDRECRLCFSLALWNGKDPILKERLYGLTGPEGNHGEDVKECYFYLESLPTHSYLKGLYKYPQAEFPYSLLQTENQKRGRDTPEFELIDSGVFEQNRYFDLFVEYAKNTPDDILIRITAANRGDLAAPLHLLPTLWFRNTWSWGRSGEGYSAKPRLAQQNANQIATEHPRLEPFVLSADTYLGEYPRALFAENETNTRRLFSSDIGTPYAKDAFHSYVVNGDTKAVIPKNEGTKGAFLYSTIIAPQSQIELRLRLSRATELPATPFGREEFDSIFEARIHECEEYYRNLLPQHATQDEHRVMRQASAGLLWSKQFYFYSVREWLEGDPSQPAPAPGRNKIRNSDWAHLYNRDVISMPDKWEYPWYAAWDLAFHMVPLASIDPDFAKQQLILLLREWYMHPNGQIPAYEFAFSDVNPPVHAWACWRVYKISAARGKRDRTFLARVFHKLLLNFNWWVNRKDIDGKNLFSGGFLGLDNIGVFDRSQPLPMGGHLEQADGTAWMAFFCATMLSIALELADEDPAYEDIASKFFEHFVAITDAINTLGGSGLWDEQDGYYYDALHGGGCDTFLRVRSLVGMIPLLAVDVLEDRVLNHLPGFRKRMRWFIENRQDLSRHISYLEHTGSREELRLLAVPSRARLERMLRYLLDEKEFLSPFGLRSLSRVHKDNPYIFTFDKNQYRVDYMPGESNVGLFGGNSNWRGPVWFPLNYLFIEAMERYHHFYGDSFRVECPTGSLNFLNLKQVADEMARRLSALFLLDKNGKRPCNGDDFPFAHDPHWKDLVLFHEYFHGDSGKGLGANHQTGWTALITRCLSKNIRARR